MLLLRCREAAAQGRYAASYVLQLCLWTITDCFLNKDSGELQHLSARNRDVFLKNASQKPTQEEVQCQAFSWGGLTGGLVPSAANPKDMSSHPPLQIHGECSVPQSTLGNSMALQIYSAEEQQGTCKEGSGPRK